MLTKNFFRILDGYIRRTGAKSYTVAGLVNYNGSISSDLSVGASTKPQEILGALGTPRADTYYGTAGGVYFGTGTTPAKPDDFRMESPITDSSVLHVDAPGETGVYRSFDGDCYRISASYDVTNTTDHDLAISELGLFGAYSSTQAYLYDHTVLDEPIIIPAGATMPINYAFEFLYGM